MLKRQKGYKSHKSLFSATLPYKTVMWKAFSPTQD